MSFSTDYKIFTGDKQHLYIPLLAVHPERRGLGYGSTIVEHLVGEAACLVAANAGRLHDAVFLDVYEESLPAFNLYAKSGFVTLGNRVFVDPLNGKGYRVMAKRVSS